MRKLLVLIVAVGLFSCREKPKKDIMFGIDVSLYQGDINWEKVKNSKHPVEFVIVRATMGADRSDKKFQQNIMGAKNAGYLVGAYHYYDPNQPSYKQAENYIKSVSLQKGDIIPIVDLERLSNCQSEKKLKKGLKRWLDIVEKKYGVKPILYSGYSFYMDCLSKEFTEYPLWIAAYSEEKRDSELIKNSAIHQFAEKVSIKGVKCKVDGNDIRREKLAQLILK